MKAKDPQHFEKRLKSYKERRLKHNRNQRRIFEVAERCGIDPRDALNETFDELRPHPDDGKTHN